MADKQAQMQGNAKGVATEHPKVQKYAKTAEGPPMKKYKHRETLKKCLLRNQKCKNMQNKWKGS